MDLFGFALYLAQDGRKHEQAKPLRGFGSAGVVEVVEEADIDLIRPRPSPHFACAVKRRWSTAGKIPPGNWFAPPGSNRSSSGGNEAAEASGVEGHVGDLASL